MAACGPISSVPAPREDRPRRAKEEAELRRLSAQLEMVLFDADMDVGKKLRCPHDKVVRHLNRPMRFAPNTRPSRQSQPPERFEVEANITSRATSQRWSKSPCNGHFKGVPAEVCNGIALLLD
jgi:hypothetical protein